MRVFYAVTLNQATKEKLAEYRDMVAENSIKGSYTSLNNFHLTLEFIGEIEQNRLALLIDALHKLKNFPKELDIYKLGSFKRKNKEIVWAGIKRNEELILLQKELRKLLSNSGFNFDNRDYTPHITLGRQIVRQQPLENIEFERIKGPVKSIALMESKRVDGELVYGVIEEMNANMLSNKFV